jgi:hypothetical protein
VSSVKVSDPTVLGQCMSEKDQAGNLKGSMAEQNEKQRYDCWILGESSV